MTADEQRLRDAFNHLAGEVVVDTAVGRPAAARALKHHARRRAQRGITVAAVVVIALVVATVAVIGKPAGDAVHTVGSTAARPPARIVPRTLAVVDRLSGRWAIEPFAYDGHDVWTAREDIVNEPGGTRRAAVIVERRAAHSGALLTSIAVPQEAVYAIAIGDNAVWVSGGGDGGVPETTVSRIDLATDRVQFTHTLTGATCSCPIVVGAGGAWLGGQGATTILRLDETTGAIAARITLPHPSESLAVVGDGLQVGLDDSRVAVVDPATNRVASVITIADPAHPAFGVIGAIEPLGEGDSRALRSDGVAFTIAGNRRLSGPAVLFLRPLGVQSSATVGPLVWATGLDQLLVSSADGRTRGYANYDLAAQKFDAVALRSRRFVPTAADANGLDRVIAAGRTLWIATFNGPIVVVAPS